MCIRDSLLSVSYERSQLWQESYAWSKAAQRLNGIAKGDVLSTDVGYPGYFVLPFHFRQEILC